MKRKKNKSKLWITSCNATTQLDDVLKECNIQSSDSEIYFMIRNEQEEKNGIDAILQKQKRQNWEDPRLKGSGTTFKSFNNSENVYESIDLVNGIVKQKDNFRNKNHKFCKELKNFKHNLEYEKCFEFFYEYLNLTDFFQQETKELSTGKNKCKNKRT